MLCGRDASILWLSALDVAATLENDSEGVAMAEQTGPLLERAS